MLRDRSEKVYLKQVSKNPTKPSANHFEKEKNYQYNPKTEKIKEIKSLENVLRRNLWETPLAIDLPV